MAGRIAVVVSCVGRVLLALLAVLLAVEAPGAGSLGLRSVVYDYDGGGSTAEFAPQRAPQAAPDQDVRGKSTSTASLRTGYDDPSQLARASARPDAYRLAPQTAARFSDDTAALCRSNSFVPATLVLMADGTTERIDDVQIGDMVMATDPETGERGPRRVTDTIGYRPLAPLPQAG